MLNKISLSLEYCSPVWGGLPQYLKEELERVQRRNLRIIGLLFNLTMVPDITLESGREKKWRHIEIHLVSITGDPSHCCYQQFMGHIIIMSTCIILDTETKYIYTYRFLSLNDTETVYSGAMSAQSQMPACWTMLWQNVASVWPRLKPQLLQLHIQSKLSNILFIKVKERVAHAVSALPLTTEKKG